MVAENALGWIFMRFALTTGGVAWGKYKQKAVAASDYQKIDDMLRMVMVGTPNQTEELIRLLDRYAHAGKLVYGLHVADRVLITCMIFDREHHHVHLVDGADGGYALAAHILKDKLQSNTEH
jgi:hypothetical protein